MVVFKEGRLGLYRLVFRSMCWNIYSCNDKCPAEHGVLIVNPPEQNTVYQSPSPRGGLQTLCPLHLGIGVARKNTGWKTLSLHRGETVIAASILGMGLHGHQVSPRRQWRGTHGMHAPFLGLKNPNPSFMESEI